MKTYCRQPISPEAAYNKAAALCSRCEYAAADIRTRLLKWGLEPQQAPAVLQRLTDEGFLNEQRFARAFVNDKFRFNGWGRVKIAYQLRAKGIGQDCIDEALAQIDEAQYEQALKQLLTTKARTLGGKEPQQAQAALLRFAASRGFEPALCYRMTAPLINASNDFD